MTHPSFRDVEQISALLDGQLPQQEAARLQLRIAADPELAAIYRQLSQSRALLRKLPARRAPRNFTLTPKMAGVRAPTPRSFPFFRFASAFASLLLILTFAANGLGQWAVNAPAAAPAYGVGGGPMTESMKAPAAPETRPQSGGGGDVEIPALTVPSDTAAAPTEETMRSMAALPTETVEQPLAKTTGEEHRVIESPVREPFQVPGWLQVVLLVIALLMAASAWFVQRQAQADFERKNKR